MKTLILKYLTNSISDKELNELHDWLKKPKNKEKFKDYIKDDYNLNSLYGSLDNEAAFINVWSNAQKQNKEIPLFKRNLVKYAVAASIVLLVSIMFLFNKDNTEANIATPIIVNNNIETGTDKAILTLEDGTNIVLKKGQEYTAKNVVSNGETIIYNAATSAKAETVYNYLTIPRGGQYFITLGDGTQVWLNSESQLKYPVNFIDGKTRSVELVYGEAYFDVSHSSNHKGSKFTVLTGEQEIAVLGTEFNVKAYKDENFIYSTLVEGKILLKTTFGKNVLAPNQQTIFDKINNKVEVETVDDVYSITSWRKGVFSFKDMPLSKIMRVLSRWYDAEVLFINKDIENIKFTGILDKDQTIEEILFSIYNTNNIKYEINNKRIIFR